MKKFQVEKIILQDDGRIQLTCDCCRRPNAYNLSDMLYYIDENVKEAVKTGDRYFFDCEYEDCKMGTVFSVDSEEIRKIVSFRKK